MRPNRTLDNQRNPLGAGGTFGIKRTGEAGSHPSAKSPIETGFTQVDHISRLARQDSTPDASHVERERSHYCLCRPERSAHRTMSRTNRAIERSSLSREMFAQVT